MKLARNILLLLIVLAALGAGSYYYYDQVYLPAQATPEPELQTARTRKGDISITASGVGNLLPAEEISVGFRSSGVLEQLNVAVGDQVEEGMLLAVLDDDALRLQLEQNQVNLQGLLSPEAVLEARLAVINREAALDKAVEDLQFLVSPSVWGAERSLSAAQDELSRLQADSNAAPESLQAAQKAVERAQQALKAAQYRYTAEYVPLTFTYDYTDTVTGLLTTSVFPPTGTDINLARTTVESAELALASAQAYTAALEAGQPCGEQAAVTAAEGTLISKLEQACLAVDQAELSLENTRLLAPVAGTVTEVSASAGQAVSTAPIITIATLDRMYLRFYMEETDFGLLKTGQRLIATFEAYPDQPLGGQVLRVEPAMQVVDGTPVVVAWAELTDQAGYSLLAGMAADVEIVAGEAQDALLVPVQALRELAPGSYAVFVVQPDGQLKLTPVTVGLKDFANAQIIAGLEEGDVVSTGTVETK